MVGCVYLQVPCYKLANYIIKDFKKENWNKIYWVATGLLVLLKALPPVCMKYTARGES